MSFNGVMRTSVSGMNAQASRLATTADNIANSDTTGYKRASMAFATLVPQTHTAGYSSGGVLTYNRTEVDRQGSLEYTNSITDLAVNGDGFFVVSDSAGTNSLTRAGSFIPDPEGRLVNTAGYYLMGYDTVNGTSSVTANGFAGLTPVSVYDQALRSSPSTAGQLQANFPSNDPVVAAADLPSANTAGAEFSGKTSLIAYDNLGNEVILDVYSAKTAAETWEISVYDRAAADVNGGFPYSAGPLSTETLNFDSTSGLLTGASPTSVTIPVPSGGTMTLDMAQSSQLATDYVVIDVAVNGNPPTGVELFEIASDGTFYASYANGERVAIARIPLANVISPNNLTVETGNVYRPSDDSGDVQVGFPGEGGRGGVVSGALEESTVDLATELTTVIEAQRSYTANSRVFQTGSELLDVLVNLSR